jgi:hypothetical protein
VRSEGEEVEYEGSEVRLLLEEVGASRELARHRAGGLADALGVALSPLEGGLQGFLAPEREEVDADERPELQLELGGGCREPLLQRTPSLRGEPVRARLPYPSLARRFAFR